MLLTFEILLISRPGDDEKCLGDECSCRELRPGGVFGLSILLPAVDEVWAVETDIDDGETSGATLCLVASCITLLVTLDVVLSKSGIFIF